MLQNAYLLAKIGADTAENERKFSEILLEARTPAARPPASGCIRQVVSGDEECDDGALTSGAAQPATGTASAFSTRRMNFEFMNCCLH